MDTHVYIDGFNLYYGLLKGTPYKWLDLERFSDQLLPRNTVTKIHYFTAKVDARPQDPDQPTRQLAYLQALSSLARVEVYLGTFMTSVVSQVVVETDPITGRYQRAGGKPVLKLDTAGQPVKVWTYKSEEKGSDVNLAAYLLQDAYRGRCGCAVIVSNDSDLLTPIGMAKHDCGLVIGLVPPRPKGSVQLKARRLQDRTSTAFSHQLAVGRSDPDKRGDDPQACELVVWPLPTVMPGVGDRGAEGDRRAPTPETGKGKVFLAGYRASTVLNASHRLRVNWALRFGFIEQRPDPE